MSEIKVGDRVIYNGSLKGTVEFAGPTHFSAGVWYGVNLDLPKGKNDGSVTGKIYFKCEKNHGIFVRMSQLVKEDSDGSSADTKSKSSGLRKPTVIKPDSNDEPESTKKAGDISESQISMETSTTAETSTISSDTTEKAAVNKYEDIDELKFQIKDLKEKLLTLQIKRSEDKEMIKDFEKMKIHVQQLEENKKYIQEKAAEYQRNMDKVKQDYGKLNEEFENYREETSMMADNIEMLTIDKEMAEEKLESYRLEIDDMKGKIEELTLENEILKLEQRGGSAADNANAEAQLVVLKVQNGKLRDAVIVMRDMNESQKAENEKLSKEFSKLELEHEKIVKERDRLLVDLKTAQESIIELKEQIDSSLGADEMVNNLTEKNLALEESVRTLEEAKLELEELCDMNNEINENNSSIISDLKEEVARKEISIQELNKALISKNECILDYEDTIEKFRDLVRDLQNQIKDLKVQAESSAESMTKQKNPLILDKSPETIKSKSYDSKTIGNVIEMELQKLQISQSSKHISILLKFLPDKFFKTGGDNDVISMLLLVDRIIYKIELLTNQLKEKYITIDEDIESPPSSFCISFYHKLIYIMNTWYIILRHYKKTLNACPLTTFSRLGSLFTEMSPNEKSIDYLIDLIRKGSLNEHTSLEPLERSICYFQTFYQVHLVNELPDCSQKLNDVVKSFIAAADAIEESSVATINILSNIYKEGSEIDQLMKTLQQFSIDLRNDSKNIRKNSVKSSGLLFSNEISVLLDKTIVDLTTVVKAVTSYCLEQISSNDEDDLKSIEVSSFYPYLEKLFEIRNVITTQPLLTKLESILKVTNKLSDSVEHGEFDHEPLANKFEEPVYLIAINFKTEISELENFQFKLEQKEEELRQAKINLKMKCDEQSEMAVRLSVSERKLTTSVKEKDELIERLEQKLEQTKAALTRKERELDQTSEALQADINLLESQKEELRKQLKETKKRNFFENINLSSAKIVETSDGSSGEVGGFITEIQTLRIIIQNLRSENLRLRFKISKSNIDQMKPLVSPKTTANKIHHLQDIGQIDLMASTSEQLTRDIYGYLSSFTVIDISKTNALKSFSNQMSLKNDFRSQFEKLKHNRLNICSAGGGDNFKLISSSECEQIGCVHINKTKTPPLGDQSNVFVAASHITIGKIHNYFSY